jgi:hypothetical protein
MRVVLRKSLQTFLLSVVFMVGIVLHPICTIINLTIGTPMDAIAAPTLPDCVNSDCNCSDFTTQNAAQAVLDAFDGIPFIWIETRTVLPAKVYPKPLATLATLATLTAPPSPSCPPISTAMALPIVPAPLAVSPGLPPGWITPAS